jgi:hypothetical protein
LRLKPLLLQRSDSFFGGSRLRPCGGHQQKQTERTRSAVNT